ncbi:hypothetical protein [Flavobacterium caeni]|uniref:Uncharacterized protein n=1 Tax=Flavobacterium caeni TaxID=490189 RepID=A0A1G5I555_9FLAO|nr:hypothetical protein [Flavobacterium caeni]SCY71245.1 hypothetical protein SAMN02927903_02109 [Flavobacterium caeni]
MEQRKTMEEDFRDKLNAREMTPSPAAWDRLDAMLSVAEEKKSRRGYGWLYVAASILGFLTIGGVFLSQSEEVVDQGREVVFEESIVAPQPEPEAVVAPDEPGAIASAEKPNSKAKTSQKKSIINQNPINQPIINQNPVEAVNEIQKPQLIASANQNATERPSVQVDADALLAEAQSALAHPKTSVKVNAKSLLSEVDRDVNLSFREKVRRRAGEVATAVLNRNIE